MVCYNLERENFSDVDKRRADKNNSKDSINTYEKSYLNSKERRKEEKARLKFERRKAYIELIDEHWGKEIRFLMSMFPLLLIGVGIFLFLIFLILFG